MISAPKSSKVDGEAHIKSYNHNIRHYVLTSITKTHIKSGMERK